MKFGPFNWSNHSNLVIQNLELDITEKTTYFYGENGVGKSTLLKLILEECLKKKIKNGYVDQNYRSTWLWWKSIFDNLEIALINSKQKKLKKNELFQSQLSWLQPLLDKPKNQFKFNEDNEINSIGLSGGQLQKAVLLRELLNNPELLLLDEAFSALDFEAVKSILEWLKEIQQGFGFQIICITHDQRILELLPGKIFTLEIAEKRLIVR
jgi:NitT/TauT family transport system ATP-binding protein